MANELRIVVIDDNPNDRSLIKRALEKEFGKLLFSEIREPREFAWNLETRFDLVITDYSLGWSDGLSILRTVKGRYPEVPVIMYTGSGNEEIAVKGLKEGLADYILKSPRAEESLVKMARAALLRANAADNEKRSELNLRRLLSRLQFATFRTDGNGVFLAWNEVFGNLFALGSAGRQTTLQTLFCESVEYHDLIRKLFEDDGVVHIDSIKLMAADGNCSIWGSLSLRLIRRINGPDEIDGIFEEKTDRKRAEEFTRQTQILKSTEKLAGNLSHEFNNVLTIIEGYTSLVIGQSLPGTANHEALKQVLGAVQRATALTRHLQAFSGQLIIHFKALDLNELLRNNRRLLRRIALPAMLDMNLKTGLPPVRGDATLLEQAITELVRICSEDGAQNGTIVLSTEESMIAPPFGSQASSAEVPHLCIQINSAGMQLPTEIKNPLDLETTSENDQSLGVAAVHGIIKQHRGWLELAHGLPKGLLFKLFLPAATSPGIIENLAPVKIEGQSKVETILVVEDDDSLREMVCEILTHYGYTTLQADSVAEAQGVYHQHKNQIHVIFADVQLPDESTGVEWCQKILADNPSQKILYTSGFPLEALKDRENVKRQGFLAKPYQADALMYALRELIDSTVPEPLNQG